MQCTCETNPKFIPAMRCISAITNANPAVVTSTVPHLYNTGLIVRLRVPSLCGMSELDGGRYQITVIDATRFSIPIDTISYQTFAIPAVLPAPGGIPSFWDICAQITPIGQGEGYYDSYSRNINQTPERYEES
jgi:hypothetical protein